MLAWKEKVADRLARLLADSPASPSPAQAAAAPSQCHLQSEIDVEEVVNIPITDCLHFEQDKEEKSAAHAAQVEVEEATMQVVKYPQLSCESREVYPSSIDIALDHSVTSSLDITAIPKCHLQSEIDVEEVVNIPITDCLHFEQDKEEKSAAHAAQVEVEEATMQVVKYPQLSCESREAKSFPAEHFIRPKTSSLSSYVFSLLPTSNLGHEQNSPCSETLRPLPPESLPKKWRGSDLTWKDPPLELSEESGSESERDERNGNFGNDQVLQSYRPINNSNGNEETSTSDCAGTLRYLTEKSMFVSPKLFAFFQSSLPGTLKGCHWVLLYSTWKHGISLRTLLRRSENIQGPCLLIVGDMQGAVFGGLLNSPLRPTEKRKYQGTNQTFVFTTIHGEPRIFRPTGANRFYYLCLNDALAFGGGGSFALCVDEDLLHGSSGSCETFGNSCLAYSPEFELKNVELWGFTHSWNRST